MKKTVLCLLTSVLCLTGCSTYLSRVDGTDGQLYPATKLNIGMIGLIGSDQVGSSVPEIVFFDTCLAVDLIPSVATDTLLLPVDLYVALKKETNPLKKPC